MNGGWRQGIRKWRYHGMPRRYAAHLRVKGLPAGSSSDLQGCKPSRSLLILLNLHRPSLSLSLSHHVSRSFIVVDNSSSCCLDNFLSARLAAQSMTQTFAIWILVGGSPLVYDPSKPSLEGLLDKEYQMNSNEKSSDWLDRSPFFFCGFFLSSSDDSY